MAGPSERVCDVIIVGGGIGGLAAAVALDRVGIAAEVFEQSSTLHEIGAGLSLWSNALRALRRLGLEDEVLERGATIERTLTRTDQGDALAEAPIGAIGREVGAPSVCIHRAALHALLADAIDPARIHLGARAAGLDEGEATSIVRFADGRSVRGRVLVGADGVNSAVRASIHGASAPRYAGYFSYRGLAAGPRRDLEPGTAIFLLGCGSQAGIFACGPDRVYWFATENAPPAGRPRRTPKLDALDRFADWCAPLPAIIEATDEDAVFRHDIVDRPPCWPWGRGRTTLLGDAAHPTTPNLGQGACQALEDAVVLAKCVQEQGLDPRSLREYERRRRSRTARITRRSRALGCLFQWERAPAVALRNLALRHLPGQERFLRSLLAGDGCLDARSTQPPG